MAFRFAGWAMLLVLGASGCYSGGGPGREISGGGIGNVGAPAISYDVKRTDGATDSVGHYKGRVVVMNLWATWCPPCREEMPALQALYREQRGRGLVVLGVDIGESSATAAAFARERGVTFPILLDIDQQYAASYRSVGLPTTVVIGRDGRVARAVDGGQTLAQFRELVAPVLAAK